MPQLNKQEQALIETISKDCKTPAEASTKLKEMFGGLLENILEAELDEHLGYEKHSAWGDGSGKSRNGHGRKTVKRSGARRKSACRKTVTQALSRR